jgi:glycosyltransferase involved in cell wall biosynthesis
MTAPMVSVIMPVYNAERYLAEAVESVLHQTFADFEFIIIDDGSTDTSLARLRRYAAQDARIRLSSRPNAGCVQTLIEAVPLATGKYIARMDADDVSLPNRFEQQVRFLEENPEYVVVGTKVLLIDAEGAPLKYMGEKRRHGEIDGAHLRGEGGAIIHPASMIRTEAIRAVGGYRLLRDEDLDLFLRLAEYGKVANLPDVLLHYRQHLNSLGYKHYAELARSVRDAVAAARVRRGLPPLEKSEVLELDVHSWNGSVKTARYHKKWAWWALQGGYPATARKHALVALRQDPLSLESWRLALFALRGTMRSWLPR